MDKSRQQFEEWSDGKDLYDISPFDIWQASRESLEVELPYKFQPSFYSYEDGVNTGFDVCADILISNGVKIKNE
ncbi:hypothetical protein ACK6ST_04855 [Proteus terrae]|nr:hypothetical protein [Proteus terrae]